VKANRGQRTPRLRCVCGLRQWREAGAATESKRQQATFGQKGAANRGQPVGSETNPPSSAAGSHR
jgi:hypothetical protein